MLSLIVALAENNAIGCGNTMPWRLPGDLKRMKELTMGKTIIMGRRTFESLPGILPGRRHVVITSDMECKISGVTVVHSLDAAVAEFTAPDSPEGFIFGGAAVYRAALPLCDRLYLTRIYAEFSADTFFPDFNINEYNIIEQSEILTDEENGLRYRYITADRI